MRPWKKRGFLHWLFFQETKKKRPAQPRRRALPQHPPKHIEAETDFEETTVAENQPEIVDTQPVPCGETAIEAKVAEFIESGLVPELTGHVQDKESDEPVAEHDAPVENANDADTAPEAGADAIPEPVEQAEMPSESEPPQDANGTQEPAEEPPIPPACGECGTRYESTDNFCGGCGTRLLKTQATQVNTYCGSCGARNEHMTNFCGGCGHKLISG